MSSRKKRKEKRTEFIASIDIYLCLFIQDAINMDI
jgi:hypothetical protein